MVLSRRDPGADGLPPSIRDFSRADENYAENFMELDEPAKGYAHGNSSSEKEMIGDVVSRVCPRILDVTVRRENGETETYSLESMTKKKSHRLVQDFREFMPAVRQRIGHRSGQAKGLLQDSLPFRGHAEAVNGIPSQRDFNSSDSQDSGRSRSGEESRTVDSTRTSRHKRARKILLESARILEATQQGSSETPSVTTRALLRIANEEAVMVFYKQILSDGQQNLCKKLAKWWIRAINPNKQTNYPYAKGPEKKPPWWPLTPPNNAVGVPNKGTTENGFVRHREPDHLAKPERLTLLPYLLNQITDPGNRTKFNCVDIAKLYQISMDSINNETTDKDKHESWRRFVKEIFRVARQQERYKDGEIDETTTVHVLPSYETWRKNSADEAEEEVKSDGEYDNEECDTRKVLTPERLSSEDLRVQIQMQRQSLGDDMKQEYSKFVHENRFHLNFQEGMNCAPSYRYANDGPSQIPNQQSYNVSMAPQSRPYQQPSLMLQEPFRRHSDTADRFPNQNSLFTFLPSTNMTQTGNPQYQTLQPVFQFPANSSSPTGPVLPLPMSAPMTRPQALAQHFPSFNDTGLFPRSTTAFQTSARDPILGSQGNMLQLSQQHQNVQDYLQDQDYCHNAPKMVITNLNNATRPEYIYDQENKSNASRSDFSYNVKRRCSLESGPFDLDEMANEGSNGQS